MLRIRSGRNGGEWRYATARLSRGSCLVLVAIPRSVAGERPGQEPAPGRIAENVVCRGGRRPALRRVPPVRYWGSRVADRLRLRRGRGACCGYSGSRTPPSATATSSWARTTRATGPMALANDALRAMLAARPRASRSTRAASTWRASPAVPAAVLAALALGERAAGVIGAAAAFPSASNRPRPMSFPYYGPRDRRISLPGVDDTRRDVGSSGCRTGSRSSTATTTGPGGTCACAPSSGWRRRPCGQAWRERRGARRPDCRAGRVRGEGRGRGGPACTTPGPGTRRLRRRSPASGTSPLRTEGRQLRVPRGALPCARRRTRSGSSSRPRR